MIKKIKFFVIFLSMISIHCFAGQGVNILLETTLNNITAAIKNPHCMKYIKNGKMIVPNRDTYVEAKNSGTCFFRKSHFTYEIRMNGTLLKSYDIKVSAHGSSMKEKHKLKDNNYQISDTFFHRSGIEFVSKQDNILFHVQKFAGHWQKDEANRIEYQAINHVYMLGSHDSGSYAINSKSFLTPDVDSKTIKFFSKINGSVIRSWAKTQNLSITEQLNLGVRYLDLRICGKKDKHKKQSEIYTCHAESGAKLDSIISQTAAFLNKPDHEKELIILDMNHLYNIDESMVDEITNSLKNKFGDKIASYDQLRPWYSYHSFWESKKQVIVIINDEEETGNWLATEKYPDIYWGHDLIYSPWPNTNSFTKLKEKMLLNLSKEESYRSTFFVLQALETPNTDNILKGLSNKFSGYPSNLFEMTGTYKLKLYPWFMEYQDLLSRKGNIILQDFVVGM